MKPIVTGGIHMNDVVSVSGVKCYEENGIAYLNIENVAVGLGFTKTDIKVSETGFRKEYTRIDWPRVKKYLAEFGFMPTSGHDAYIPENIFYRLAMKAKNETAERFQALVADKIIPSIRKNGGYIAGQEQLSDQEILAKALLVAQRTIESKNKQISEMQPKALFADAVSASNVSILVGELAKVLRQNHIEIGEKRLFAWMRDNGYLIRRKGTDYNMPTQKSMEMGLFQIKETVISHSNGHTTVSKTPKVTGKGQQYFINKFISQEQ